MRFRKSFPLAGHFLHWTISKNGISLNAHLGPVSRSWGTRGNTSTIDAPGHIGLFWRKQTRRTHTQHDIPHDRGSGWFHLALGFAALETVVEAFHIWVHPFSNVTVSGQPLLFLAVLSGLLVAFILFCHHLRLAGGFLLIPIALIGVYVQWKLFGSIAWHDVHAIVSHSSPVSPAPH